MSLLSRIVGRIFRPRESAGPPVVRAGYDAADYDLANNKHWEATDSYSPNAQLDSTTRQTLRDRSRYEAGNNSYYGGVIETIGGDVVGSGPRPQILIPGDADRRMGRLFESWYRQWAGASAFAEDLTLMQESTVRDGESFAVLVDNPGLLADGRTRVSLDLAIYEAEQVSDPWDFGIDPLYTDGVRVDEFGNPTEYALLKNHPGGVTAFRSWEVETLPAWQVCHWFKRKRAGQTRGVPWMVAALPLFAQLRRYTLATLSAAELAAMLAGVMQTDGAAGEQAMKVEAMDVIEMARGALLTLPQGWSASQFKPEQPVTSYGSFKTELLNEAGRGGNVPLNIVSGNSSGYNYSSARLDRQLYYAAIRRERGRMVDRFLDRLFMRWAREAMLAYAAELASLGFSCPPPEAWSWTWFWDGIVSIDPQKDAAADAANLENGTTTLAKICAENGDDWEDVIRQRAAEKKLIAELGAGPEKEPPAPEQGQEVEPAPDAPPEQPGAVAGAAVLEVTAAFEEGKHPRAEDGKFGSGGAGGAAKKASAAKKPAAKKPAAKKPAAKKAPAKKTAPKPAPKKAAPKKPAAKKTPAKEAEPATGDAAPASAEAPKKKAAPKKAPAKKKPGADAAETPKPAAKKAPPAKKPAAKKEDPKPEPKAETPVQKPDISSHSDDELKAEYERRFGKPGGTASTPAAPKKTAPKKAAVAELPEKHHALRDDVKSFAERASKDPHAVTDAEIDSVMEKVQHAKLTDAEMKRLALDVAGVKETTKAKALGAIRGKLTAAKRIFEGQKS